MSLTRLLIVDDSALMRKLLSDIFTEAGDFTVEIARSGSEALEKFSSFSPDVVTLDINMPDMNGLACLDQIMLHHPTPVVMISSLTSDGASETLNALALGAVDFIEKPRGPVSLGIDAITSAIIEKVRSAATARVSRTTRLRERLQASAAKREGAGLAGRSPPRPRVGSSRGAQTLIETGLVVVGASTGGPPALEAVLSALPAQFPWPILISQHMPASFTGPMARRLDRVCALAVREVEESVSLEPGCAYIGRGDADVIVSRRGGEVVARSAPKSADFVWHPSVDRLVQSAMRILEPRKLIGVLMTGMGNDGALAMSELKTRGGFTIAEAAETAVVWGMPGALVALNGASMVRPIDEIAEALVARLAL